MKILINDIMQISTDAPDSLKSPALSDVYTTLITFNITFAVAQTINAVGIGYTDATQLTVSDGTTTRIIDLSGKTGKYKNGLYIIDSLTTHSVGHYFTITHNGTYLGRLALGTYRTLGTTPTKEIGFYTTNENRLTLSGQVIPGAGGYSGRRFEADVRYKIDTDIYDDIETAYDTQISRGFPFFLYLDDEQHKLPVNMERMYMRTDLPITLLQSSSYRYLYSYKFKFYEAY